VTHNNIGHGIIVVHVVVFCPYVFHFRHGCRYMLLQNLTPSECCGIPSN